MRLAHIALSPVSLGFGGAISAPTSASPIHTSDLAVGHTIKLSKERTIRLQTLAEAVLKGGVESRRRCQPSMDRTILLSVSAKGHVTNGTAYCPSAKTEALIAALLMNACGNRDQGQKAFDQGRAEIPPSKQQTAELEAKLLLPTSPPIDDAGFMPSRFLTAQSATGDATS